MGTPSFGSEARDSQMNNRTKIWAIRTRDTIIRIGHMLQTGMTAPGQVRSRKKIIAKFKFQEY